jgi:hypothetical protein
LSSALVNSFNVKASSEWPGTNVRNIDLDLKVYDWKTKFTGIDISAIDIP